MTARRDPGRIAVRAGLLGQADTVTTRWDLGRISVRAGLLGQPDMVTACRGPGWISVGQLDTVTPRRGPVGLVSSQHSGGQVHALRAPESTRRPLPAVALPQPLRFGFGFGLQLILIYLKARVRDSPPAGSFPKWPQWLELGQAKARNLELTQVSHVGAGPQHLGQLKLGRKWSSRRHLGCRPRARGLSGNTGCAPQECAPWGALKLQLRPHLPTRLVGGAGS